MPRRKLIKYSIFTRTVGIEWTVYNREGAFYVEYNNPITNDHKESRSLRLRVDENLVENSPSHPVYSSSRQEWWLKSKHSRIIKKKIAGFLFLRDNEVITYLKKQSRLDPKRRNANYKEIIGYLLKKDKPLIAYFFSTCILELGLRDVFKKFSKKDFYELDGAYAFRLVHWMEIIP